MFCFKFVFFDVTVFMKCLIRKLTNQKWTVRIGDFVASWHLPSLLSLFNVKWSRELYFVFLVLL